MHPNHIYNPDFSRDLDGWAVTGTAVHVTNEGYNELGAVLLAASGDSISREFTINMGRSYMLEVAVKGTASGSIDIAIANDSGSTLYQTSQAVTTAWTVVPGTRIGLPWGTHTITISYSDTAVYVDDISVAYVPITRAEIASQVAERLGVLATNASMSTTPNGAATEGDYTSAVDVGLRKVGAIDPAGRPDVRYIDPDSIDAVLGETELAMLHKLHRYWSTQTDYSLGPRTEHISQVNAAIERLIGIAVGGRDASAARAIKTRKLIHKGYPQ